MPSMKREKRASRPGISVIIPWKGRPEILETLEKNEPYFRSHDAEIIIVISGAGSISLTSLLQTAGIQYADWLCLDDSVFNKSRAINSGIFVSRSPAIFVLDADILLTPDFIGATMGALTGSTFCTAGWVDETLPSGQSQITTSLFSRALYEGILRDVNIEVTANITLGYGRSIKRVLYKESYVNGAHSGPGLLIAEKDHLLAIEGFNSELSTWGWEDNDVLLRLGYVLGLEHVEVGRVTHLSHSDKARNIPPEGRFYSDLSNMAHCCEQYGSGNFKGTYAADTSRLHEVLSRQDDWLGG
jgi:glycosyltransferase involved in cell wall biosynthesis